MQSLKRCRSVLTILLISTILLTACGDVVATTTQPTSVANTVGNAPKSKILQLVMILKGHPVHRIVQLGFFEQARKLGYQPELLASDSALFEDAVSLGERGLASNPAGAIVWAVSPDYYPYIKKLSDAKVNVVVPHFPITEGAAPGVKVNIGADPVLYAKDAAEAIGQKLGGKGTVAITQGSFNTVEDLAAKSFADTMKAKYPNIIVLPAQEEGFDLPVAISKAVAIINANPNLTAVFSTTGGGPTTWSVAQDQTKKQLTVIGVDYTRQNLDLIKAGKIYAVVAQPLYQEAVESVIILDKLIKGETVPYKNVLPAPLVTADKVDTYLEIVKRSEEVK